MKNIKVCHITSAHQRHDVRIFEKECVSLSNFGYEVYEIVNDDAPDEEYGGVHIVSTGFVPVNRLERMFKSMKYILKLAIEIDADIYHLHDPELLQVVKELRKIGKIVIFDAHEDTETQIMDKQYIPFVIRRIVACIYGLYSRRMMCKCDGIITVTPQFVEKYQAFNENTIMVTNYPILEVDDKDDDINERDVQDSFVFFAGGISSQWCHDNIIKAVKNLAGVKYKYAGRSDDEYITYLNRLGSNSSEYIGVLPHAGVRKLYRASVAGMALLKCSQVGDEGTLGNTKLFEIMQAGKPVICSNLRLWRQIIEEYDCGICVDCNNVDEIAKAIEYIINNPAEAQKMGEAGKRAVKEKYNWNIEASKLYDFYSDLLGQDITY